MLTEQQRFPLKQFENLAAYMLFASAESEPLPKSPCARHTNSYTRNYSKTERTAAVSTR